MAVRILVDYAELARVRASWQAHAFTLDAATRRMGRVTAHALSPTVAGETARFADAWHAEVRALAARAQDAADAFGQVGTCFVLTDRAQAEHLRSLLPWRERHVAIREV